MYSSSSSGPYLQFVHLLVPILGYNSFESRCSETFIEYLCALIENMSEGNLMDKSKISEETVTIDTCESVISDNY